MFDYILDTEGFPPRWNCGTAWAEEPWLGWLHIGADLATFLAYLAIPMLLIFALRRSRHAPAPKLLSLFAVFILACGAVHLLEAIIFWSPVYRLSAVVKLVTAIASTLTAGMLAVYLPRLLAYRSPEELEVEVTQQMAELAEAHDNLEFAFAAASMGGWDWNLGTGEVRFEPNWLTLTGLSPEPGAGEEDPSINVDRFFECVHPEDLPGLRKVLDEVIATNANYDHEFRFTTPQGQTKWLAGRGRILIEPGKPDRFIGLNFDITRQKRAEAELAEARQQAEAANQAKSRFLANTSHEIRTPLTAILGCAELLERSAETEDSRQAATLIKRQSQLLQRLLNDVLDLSKIEADRLEIDKDGLLDVETLLDDIRCLIDPLASEKDLEFGLTLQPEAPRFVMTDPLRVRQVLMNLVANAIKFTKKGGVEVVVSKNTNAAPAEICFAVADTGVGIPEHEQEGIFEAFHQIGQSDSIDASLRGVGGVGLGLAICSRLASLLDGRIELSSRPGKGSTFSLYLPIRVPTPEMVRASQGPSVHETPVDLELPQTKVLIAEDTRSIQFLLRRLMEPYAETIDVVEDGREAIDQVEAAEQSGDSYGLILLDMNMAECSGYEVARTLRSGGVTTPIIAVTASAMEGDRQRCLDAGCSAYISKPIDTDRLDREVRRLLSALAER